jgi:hypothetical protein
VPDLISHLENHSLLDGLFSLVVALGRAGVSVPEGLLHILKPCPDSIEKMTGEGRAAGVGRVAAEAVAIDSGPREGGIEYIADRLIAHGLVAAGPETEKEHMVGIVDRKAPAPNDLKMLLDGGDGDRMKGLLMEAVALDPKAHDPDAPDVAEVLHSELADFPGAGDVMKEQREDRAVRGGGIAFFNGGEHAASTSEDRRSRADPEPRAGRLRK